MPISKIKLKNMVGELPLVPEVYWQLRSRGKPLTENFSLRKLEKLLPQWCAEAVAATHRVAPARKVFLFATLRYWLEHVTLLSNALAGLGHTVTLAYLPYAKWQIPIDRFDARRHSAYAQAVLKKAEPLLQIVPLLTTKKADTLPAELEAAIKQNALRDTQYTLQVEEVNPESELFKLRLERDMEAARAALEWLTSDRPDVVVIPNGTILEFGAVYQTARFLDIPTITYEFGEQHQRIWLAQNAEVMRQNTDELWAAHKDRELTETQLEQVRALFASRQRASLWENGDKSHRFTRRWQGIPNEGGEKVRADLGLDARPVVLLATNVIGDSLTLGRQVFSDSMTEWLERTAQYFAYRPDVQLVIRIHPGELVTKGPSVADVVRRVLPEAPEHIRLIPADAKTNTYDVVEIADLGLVYTTTIGMEMAMSGVPVIAVGNTHYRAKGFTLDPVSWEAYFETLGQVLESPKSYRLTGAQVDLAWAYAYSFFFEYPHLFPWHLVHIWKDLEEWSVARVLSPEGQAKFGETFRYLVGEPVDWRKEGL